MKSSCSLFVLILLVAVGGNQALGLIDAPRALRNFVAGVSVLASLAAGAQIIAIVAREND
jgi:hypothetical protein